MRIRSPVRLTISMCGIAASETWLLRKVPNSSCSCEAAFMFLSDHSTLLPAICRYSTTACSCSSANFLFTMVVVVTAIDPSFLNALFHSSVMEMGT